jgi:uncharacterized protein VirK/YbjX
MGKIRSRFFQLSANALLKFGIRGPRATSNDSLIPAREFDERFGLLRSLLILARQRKTWSPVMILGELWRLFTNLGLHREILGLLKLRPFAEIVQDNPRWAFKYVIPDYLARSFTLTERVSCFLHHYRRIHSALPENVLRQILQGDVTLHEISDGVNCFVLTMGLPEPYFDQEGELSLNLQVNGKKVFTLCFTIVPGWVLKSEAAEIVLITRLQGATGCNSEIKLARKVLHDYSPRGPLLAALQGIAGALGIGELRAVSATNQRSYSRKRSPALLNGYDDFFAKVGMVKTSGGFYSSPIPIEGKSLDSFRGSKRSRARKRRAMRQQIELACASFLLEVTDRTADSSPSEVCRAPVLVAVEPQLTTTSCPTPDKILTIEQDELSIFPSLGKLTGLKKTL